VYSGVDTNGPHEKALKAKDKRLLEFLARGMTADDFEEFVASVSTLGYEGAVSGDHYENLRPELIKNLWQWRNTPTHDTPFNHGFFSFEVKAPIFVRAQLVKHEYLIMSEYSRRYITDDIEFYEPDVWRGAAEDKKQGSSGEITTSCVMDRYGEHTHPMFANRDVQQDTLGYYNSMIKAGVAPEQARMVLPQSLMTAWTWSGTLGAFAKMCQLRCHPEAQYESRLVADKVYKELKKQFPVAAPLLVEGVY
jgi:thymidylate synthase (FAD)